MIVKRVLAKLFILADNKMAISFVNRLEACSNPGRLL